MTNIIQEYEKTQITRAFPDIKPGDTVRVHQKIKEESTAKGKKSDKERVQIFEGLVLRIRGGLGINGSFLVRKTASGVGVEKNFPIHMPSLEKVEVVKRGKVRRARLYYLRDKKEKESKLQEIKLSDKDLKDLKYEEEVEEPKKVKADKKVEGKKDAGKKDNGKKEPQTSTSPVGKTQKGTEDTEKVKDKPKDKPETKDKAKDNKKPKSKKEPKDKAKDFKK